MCFYEHIYLQTSYIKPMINTFTFHLWIMDSGFISFHWSLEKYYCPNITAAFPTAFQQIETRMIW